MNKISQFTDLVYSFLIYTDRFSLFDACPQRLFLEIANLEVAQIARGSWWHGHEDDINSIITNT